MLLAAASGGGERLSRRDAPAHDLAANLGDFWRGSGSSPASHDAKPKFGATHDAFSTEALLAMGTEAHVAADVIHRSFKLSHASSRASRAGRAECGCLAAGGLGGWLRAALSCLSAGACVAGSGGDDGGSRAAGRSDSWHSRSHSPQPDWTGTNFEWYTTTRETPTRSMSVADIQA